MSPFGSRTSALLLGAALVVLAISPANAQATPDQKPPEQGQKTPADKPAEPGKDEKRKVDQQLAEAAQMISGPAGNPECVWIGRKVVSLLWRDDLDTAFRHLDIYDRFGCPGPHIQASFRCFLRQAGSVDPKSSETVNDRIHACWVTPSLPPATAAAPPPMGAQGTSSQ